MLAALAPFLPALGAGFVNWDDEAMLIGQTGYRTSGAWRWALASTVMGHWSPLAWLSFTLDHRLGGLDPRVFHATSLALHGLEPSAPAKAASEARPHPRASESPSRTPRT